MIKFKKEIGRASSFIRPATRLAAPSLPVRAKCSKRLHLLTRLRFEAGAHWPTGRSPLRFTGQWPPSGAFASRRVAATLPALTLLCCDIRLVCCVLCCPPLRLSQRLSQLRRAPQLAQGTLPMVTASIQTPSLQLRECSAQPIRSTRDQHVMPSE